MSTDPENKPTREEALEQVIEIANSDGAIPQSELDAISGGGGGRLPKHGIVGGGSA